MLVLTVWSRISVGCETSYQKIIFNIMFGMIRGSLFFYFFSSQYQNLDVNKSGLEKTACEKEYSDYTCETIKDGNVIVKKPLNNPETDNSDNSDNSD